MYSCSKTVLDMVIIDMFPLYAFVDFFYILKNLSTIITVYMIIDRGVLEEDGEIMSFFIY